MRSALLKRPVVLTWVALWLFSWLSVSLLHSHDSHEHSQSHTSCLVCHIADQPAPSAPETFSLTRVTLAFTEQPMAVPQGVVHRASAQLRPFVPRGPPARPSFSLL